MLDRPQLSLSFVTRRVSEEHRSSSLTRRATEDSFDRGQYRPNRREVYGRCKRVAMGLLLSFVVFEFLRAWVWLTEVLYRWHSLRAAEPNNASVRAPETGTENCCVIWNGRLLLAT
jgi:hypothetical protein